MLTWKLNTLQTSSQSDWKFQTDCKSQQFRDMKQRLLGLHNILFESTYDHKHSEQQ